MPTASEAMKKRWQDPEYRKRMLKVLAEGTKKSVQARKERAMRHREIRKILGKKKQKQTERLQIAVETLKETIEGLKNEREEYPECK